LISSKWYQNENKSLFPLNNFFWVTILFSNSVGNMKSKKASYSKQLQLGELLNYEVAPDVNIDKSSYHW